MKNATAVLEKTTESLQETMEKTGKNVNTFIVANKMHVLNEYVCLFISNFKSIIDEYKLSRNEIRVVLQMLDYMKFGNLISISNSTLARDCGIDPRNMSKIMNKIKDLGLMFEMDGNKYFNPHIACKGALDEKDTKDERLLDYSAIIIDERLSMKPSIATKNIRRKIHKEHEELKSEVDEKIAEFYK